MEKKRFGAFLKHFSLAQNTLKSDHKWPKSRFNLQGTVFRHLWTDRREVRNNYPEWPRKTDGQNNKANRPQRQRKNLSRNQKAHLH